MNKKIQLLIQIIEQNLSLLKMELEDTEPIQTQLPDNTIKITDLIQTSEQEEQPEYYEEPDEGPSILLNTQEQEEFYKRFKL